MNNSSKKILVLSARTGGGHRAAALAVIGVLKKEPNIEVFHHDIFENAPRPLNKMPKFYSSVTKVKSAWGTIFKLTEGNKQSEFTLKASGRLYKKTINDVLDKYEPDLILSFHFGANAYLHEARSINRKITFITVVTDLATAHPMWFDKRNDLIIVPSTESYIRARNFGVPSPKLKIIGLPTKSGFADIPANPHILKKKYNWPDQVPTLLVMAGGDGMGKISGLVKKLDSLSQDVHLAVIAGRNKNLETNLKSRDYKKPVSIYGFRDDIADMMHASDVLLTKAGPGTIVEGIVSRLPIVLYDFLPGQEEGNLMYVVENLAGVWASTSILACNAVEDILDGRIKIGGPKYEKIRQQHISAAVDIAKLVSKSY